MATSMRALCAVLLLCAAGGCVRGIIYHDTTRPLTRDMRETPIADARAEGSRVQIKEPITREGLRAEWASFAIGDAAERGGLRQIDYADIRKRSILGGIWEKTTVIVYGKRESASCPGCTPPRTEQSPPR